MRFTRPVEVPDPGQAEVVVVGKVGAMDLAASSVRVDLTVTSGGVSVLAKAQALVQLR